MAVLTQRHVRPEHAVVKRRRFWRHRLDVKGSPYLYIAPFFVVFGVFGFFPLVYTAYVSLTGWRADTPGSEDKKVGFANYVTLWHDPFFWNALKNTIGIGLISTVPQLLLALGIAHRLNYRLRGRTFVRMGVLLPNVTSVAAVTIIFVQLFGRDYGLINWLLGLVGVDRIEWQAGTLSSWLAISVIVTWRWTGYNALFNVSQTPTAGGSQHQFQTLALYTYDQFWQKFKYGYGAAISWAMFGVILLCVVVNLLIARRMRGVEAS